MNVLNKINLLRKVVFRRAACVSGHLFARVIIFAVSYVELRVSGALCINCKLHMITAVAV